MEEKEKIEEEEVTSEETQIEEKEPKFSFPKVPLIIFGVIVVLMIFCIVMIRIFS